MKKVVSAFFVIILTLSITVAFAVDYSSMTEEQLNAEYNAIRNELVTKGFLAEKKTIILDQDGIQIYINGDFSIDKPYSWASSLYLYLPIIVVNNSDRNINIRLENASLNGWSVNAEGYDCSTPAGKKSKASLYFSIEDADIENISDFTDAEFVIIAYDTDTLRNVIKSNAITIYAK